MLFLNINIVPHGDFAHIHINDKSYFIDTAMIQNLADLRKVFDDQPDHIYGAVLGMLQKAASAA